MKIQPPPVIRPRFNPFCLPSETWCRFLLMWIFIATVTFELGHAIRDLLFDKNSIKNSKPYPVSLADGSMFIQRDYLAIRSYYLLLAEKALAKRGDFYRERVTELIALVIMLAIVCLNVRLIRRRMNCAKKCETPLEVISALQKCAKIVGVSCPRLIMLADPYYQAARTYSNRGVSIVQVGSGIQILMKRKPEIVDVILIHELGHIKNKDILIIIWTEALWKSFLWFTVPAFLLLLASLPVWIRININKDIPWFDLFIALGKPVMVIVGFFLIALKARSQIYQTRELYADARIVQAGYRTQLMRLLEDLAKNGRPWFGILLSAFSLHPNSSIRLSAIKDGKASNSLGFGACFIVGAMFIRFMDLIVGNWLLKPFFLIFFSLLERYINRFDPANALEMWSIANQMNIFMSIYGIVIFMLSGVLGGIVLHFFLGREIVRISLFNSGNVIGRASGVLGLVTGFEIGFFDDGWRIPSLYGNWDVGQLSIIALVCHFALFYVVIHSLSRISVVVGAYAKPALPFSLKNTLSILSIFVFCLAIFSSATLRFVPFIINDFSGGANAFASAVTVLLSLAVFGVCMLLILISRKLVEYLAFESRCPYCGSRGSVLLVGNTCERCGKLAGGWAFEG